MKPDRWPEIDALLDELLDLPADRRRARLDEVGARDPDLRAAVEPFLGADTDVPGPLDVSLDTYAAAVFDGEDPAPEHAAIGTRIGPYRVVAPIGEGGMGSVFLAERTDGEFEQRVALKLVRGGRPDIVERFRHERRILARLRHPNIATLIDGGMTGTGEPYFAMEHVDGERITDYCDRNRCDIDARLTLFGDVCRAVQYAHRNLVVHRDIKPGNVFVTTDGTVKLLDFGIAKIVDAENESGATTTRRFLTPAYAAPEQILAEPTSTATDIYALGVLLYELLTGRNPHGDTSSSAHVARAVVESAPPSASTAVDETRATARGGDGATIRRRLRGDIDNILQKALRKAPEERYATAEELRADLERHRHRLPISARPATIGYRLSRFARRNRIGAAAVVAVIVAVLLGMSGVVWQAAVAARERDRARAETARAEATQGFLLDVFSAADPAAETGEAITAVELARRGARRIASSFPDEPAIAADVTQMLGKVFLRLGEYEQADTLLSRAVEAHRRLGNTEGVVAGLNELGETYQWLRRLDDSKMRLEESVRLGEASLGADHRLVSNAQLLLGMTYFHAGDYETAERIVRASLEHVRRVHGPQSELAGTHLTNLGTVLRSAGDLPGAAAALREALAIERTRHPEGGVSVARILASLGDTVDDLDQVDEAETLLREALDIFRREYGREGHSELAITLSNLAGTVRRRGDLEEAERLGRESLEMFSRALGPEHAYVARAHNNLAVTLARLGQRDAAVEAYGEAVRIGKLSFGPRHPALIGFLSNQASLLTDLGRFEEAEAAYEDALAIASESNTDAVGRTYALLGLANVRRKTGRIAESETLTREAWEARKALLGEGHSAELHTRVTLASILAETRRFDEARALLDTAIRDARAGGEATRNRLDIALEERAITARDSGEPDSVQVACLRELVALRREMLAPDDPKITRIEAAIAAFGTD